ncbi:hypothetical protein Clacol_010451 [Clathrus columnatus]|uniref:RING-type domain-containing protein n=1 Tax=Clathrus columnatus TaxID=1419009 RepID=A0AAV5ANE3_9AGAM|nr:hypothetical protein Clacol_010451 [Clathrus columnatus]
MLLAFRSLKRKFSTITEESDEQQDNITTTDSFEACIPRKRLRVDEINVTKKRKQGLKARLKELQELNVRINKEAEHHNTRCEELMAANVICMICREIIQNPQSMSCGHNACYSCLRKLWTHPPAQEDSADLIDTDAESDLDDHEGARDESEVGEPAPRRRHRFTSAVNRKKHCPYCKKLIMRRPVPNYRLREVGETLGSDISRPSKAPSAHRCRNDVWHGIFHPENGDSAHLTPGAEEVRARRERERLEAFEEGRRRGVLETRQRWERAEAARRTAMARPIQMHELRFGQSNLFRPRHAPLVIVAVPPAAAAPIPQIPDGLAGQDLAPM